MEKQKRTNEERRSQAVAAIIDSAREHFARAGFSGASISLIAKNADVNPSLIYHYFENKEELWKAVKRAAVSSDPTLNFLAEDTSEDLYGFIKRALTKRFEFYQAQPDILKLITWEQLQSNDSQFYGTQGDFKWPWNDEIKRLIKEGEARKDLDPELAAFFMISALRTIFTDIPNLYGKSKAAKKQKEYLQFTIDSIYRAFAAPKAKT
jgi:AcrR family transcriptional regulator